MLDGTQDYELIRQAAVPHSVSRALLHHLLALAPRFENLNIHGVKAEFTRSVELILDGIGEAKNNGAKE